MIKTREQRKASTLLKRRKMAIIISLVLVAVLTLSLVLIYNHFTTVIPFTDLNGDKYEIKKVDGIFAMYDEKGALVPMMQPFGMTDKFYETAYGTCVYVDPSNGNYEIKGVPDIYYDEDGEYLDSALFITVFKSVSGENIKSIEIHNQNDSFTLIRNGSDKLDFVLQHSPFSAINTDILSYIAYIVGTPTVSSRLDGAIKDANGAFSAYGLVPEERTDAEGNVYQYTPSYYTITTLDGIKHTMIIGERLLTGEGYYAQYQNNSGVKRDAVYVFNPPDTMDINGTCFENTVLAASKDIIVPTLAYLGTQNDYFDVENFAINKRIDGSLEEIIKFSYIDLEDRTGTTQGIHPYVFSGKTLKGYHPNYDNIGAMLSSLIDPTIIEVSVLSPSNDDKVKYGLMSKTELEDGTAKYNYNSAYTIEFDRKVTFSYTDDAGKEVSINENVHQTMYISSMNEDGNYYVYTELRFLDTAQSSNIKGFALNTICEVSGDTLNFLVYDNYDWIYPSFMQIGIKYASSIELISKNYNAKFNIIYSKAGDTEIMEIEASNDKGEKVKTFGGMYFTDAEGYLWTVTDSKIKMFTPDGKTEVKPSTRKYEHNSLGEQVQVIDGYRNAANGDLVYVEKDYIKIKHLDGSMDTYLRYHNSIFRNFFATITGTVIVDSYNISAEEEKAIIENPDNKLLTIKITDIEGSVFTYNFYTLTARKSYITVGDEEQVGGFYIQSTRVEKFINDAKKFFSGEVIDPDAHK